MGQGTRPGASRSHPGTVAASMRPRPTPPSWLGALPPVAAWFGVSLATLAADLRFAWGQNSAVHGEFMGFRELPRFCRLSCEYSKCAILAPLCVK